MGACGGPDSQCSAPSFHLTSSEPGASGAAAVDPDINRQTQSILETQGGDLLTVETTVSCKAALSTGMIAATRIAPAAASRSLHRQDSANRRAGVVLTVQS